MLDLITHFHASENNNPTLRAMEAVEAAGRMVSNRELARFLKMAYGFQSDNEYVLWSLGSTVESLLADANRCVKEAEGIRVVEIHGESKTIYINGLKLVGPGKPRLEPKDIIINKVVVIY